MLAEYTEMTINEVYGFLNVKLPSNAKVYEIGCGEKSATVIRDLMNAGKVVFYQGYDISEEAVNAAKKAGLEAEVVNADHDHMPGFKKVASKGNAALVMMGLPEVAPDTAKQYAQQAEEAGLKVVAYPPL